MVYIYILRLDQNKYYVGRSERVHIRLGDHFNNTGSFWTIKYKPLSVKKVIQNCDNFDEDKFTIKMMEKYGVNNVRGGSFSRLKLSREEFNIIGRMINNSNDRCFKCSSYDHYCLQCNNYEIKNYKLVLLKNKLMKNCKNVDIGLTGKISIDNFVEQLFTSDDKIFEGIIKENIIIWSKLIKKNTMEENILIEENTIYYKDFCNGLVKLMDDELEAQ